MQTEMPTLTHPTSNLMGCPPPFRASLNEIDTVVPDPRTKVASSGADLMRSETRTFSFGPFTLAPDRQMLVKGTEGVRIGMRSLEILSALVERAGELVTKSELMARVWPDTFVDDSNLKVNMAGLRRALGDDQASPRYIATTSGRGYRFIAPVECSAPTLQAAAKHNLPVQTTRVIGREKAVKAVTSRLAQQRLVTITGTGGIGKTTVALSVASQMLSAFEHGVWFIDLALLPSGVSLDTNLEADSISRALARVFGLAGREELIKFLTSRRMLIVLDNCEHLIGSVAQLADGLIQHTDDVHILATSRESLSIREEQVYRLEGLESPRDAERLTAAEAVSYSAIELFIDRAAACAGYKLTDEDVPIVSDICQKLDGIPLAIELVTARVDSLALMELSEMLGKSLSLLNRGRRTAPARHQTMIAALDWSYELLSENERSLFHRVAMFTGAFPLESASAVAGGGSLHHGDIVEGLASLVAKSLVLADITAAVTRYRLLDTTRAYGLQKLQDCVSAPLPSAC
jgi:predicted ATPase